MGAKLSVRTCEKPHCPLGFLIRITVFTALGGKSPALWGSERCRTVIIRGELAGNARFMGFSGRCWPSWTP